MLDVTKISGIKEFKVETETLKKTGKGNNPAKSRNLYKRSDNEKVFLVVHPQTLELRTDAELLKLLTVKYESVMPSRYFGRGGVEIVTAGHQLEDAEIEDLIRLSYNLSGES